MIAEEDRKEPGYAARVEAGFQRRLAEFHAKKRAHNGSEKPGAKAKRRTVAA